jgi:ribokinase
MEQKKNIDFLAIGDIVVDAFIKLKDAHVHCNIDTNACELCVRFGDKIPYEFVEVVYAVGNSPNAAVSASRLGLSSALVTSLGNDENGKACLNVLKREKVNTRFVTIDKGKPTNYHYVLWYGAERTILTKHADFKYHPLKNVPPVSWLYLSSLGSHALSFHKDIENYLKKNKSAKLAFQPGTYQISLGYKKLKYFYDRADIFFCNKEEAQRILKTKDTNIKALLRGMKKLGPKIVSITDGPKGAYVFDGKEAWFTPMYPDPKPPYDRTGAGDAFASTFTSLLALGYGMKEALQRAPINSMSVVQFVGAQKGLLGRKDIERWLKRAPKDYKLKRII